MGHWICAGHNPIWQNMADAQGDHSRGGWTYKWVISRDVLSAIMEFVHSVTCLFLEETLFSYVSEGLKKGCKDWI